MEGIKEKRRGKREALLTKLLELMSLKKQFNRYFLVGVTATLIDWITFFVLAILLQAHHMFALITAFSLASIVHYTLNKVFTFRCSSKEIFTQFSAFLIVALSSLAMSSALLYLFVDVLLVHKMISRIMVTFLVFLINYLLHSKITFNKKYFS